MADELRLPIKIVLPVEGDFKKPSGGGSARKLFGEVTEPVRDALVSQVQEVSHFFESTFEEHPRLPAVAKVVLKDKAIAKTHRPKELFSKNTCPIIGVRDFGEILISVQPQGLSNLREKLRSDHTKTGIANISTVESIKPFSTDDALRMSSCGQQQLLEDGSLNLKFRMFRHNDRVLDQELFETFNSYLNALNLTHEMLRYGKKQLVYRIKGASAKSIRRIASFVGTQSLSDFPRYRAVRSEAISLREAQVEDFPAPEEGEAYPVVGIVDTGVNPNDPLLSPWVVARENFVATPYHDYNHGSFVAGLVINGRRLNHDDSRFPGTHCKVVDVVAIPGQNQSIGEDDLLSILEEVVPKYPSVKIWNLSLGMEGEPCADEYFSDFAAALDRIQEENGIRFVIAAGNYRDQPYRGWPPEDLGENDRIRPPSDSVRAITVGAIAHVDRQNTRVRAEEPAPFTRRGPGACFLPKPEVSHYGGNCDAQGKYQQTGILSVNGNHHLSEDVGTSFATPLVSSLFASIHDSLTDDTSAVLSKALLVHSAMLSSESLKAEDLRYRGFGIPADIHTIMTCSPHSATLIFEPDSIRPGLSLVKEHFPIPDCLRTDDGKVKCEFLITLAYDPHLDINFGAEYCRRNIEVSLGTYEPSGPKAEHASKVPCEPRDISKQYEKYLIEHGFKWSPVKVYRNNIPRGIAGKHWRLVIKAENRKEHTDRSPTPLAVVVTIRDPSGQLPVYDEVVTRMSQSGWITQDLRVSDRIRTRVQN